MMRSDSCAFVLGIGKTSINPGGGHPECRISLVYSSQELNNVSMKIRSMFEESTMTRRTQQAEERREQLIDTALRVFAEKGWDATSIPDLARAAGVAQGLMYHYFSN